MRALFLLMVACKGPVAGNGQVVAVDHEVAAFDGLIAQGDCDVRVTAGQTRRVSVSADRNLQPFVSVQARDQVLYVHVSDRARPSGRITIEVETPSLRHVESVGNAHIIAADLDNHWLRVTAADGSRIDLHGQTERLRVFGSERAIFDGSELTADRVEVHVADAADAVVRAYKTLELDLAGQSSVRYYGDPDMVKQVAGTARVQKID
jgi:hypothetical protein